MRLFSLIFLSFILMGCREKKEKVISCYEKVVVDEDLVHNDTIRLLSKFPELRLFKKEKLESKTRTAYILQNSGLLNFTASFDNYKCSAEKSGDTINISLNNYDGYISNGIMIKVFDGTFRVHDYDPKTLKDEVKFIGAVPRYEILHLNKSDFQKNDSIFGYVNYSCVVKGGVSKSMQGYFKTKIQ
ncbi:hypothetical protein [Chryseobacterium sp. Leaf394]|uniref:hypothetical protein n=1 Tax=Chryseobacterium sp. Leaf394 TaxID=1736361 RepID=UPI0006F6194A|nr:hypothetical protein [Chryseobacterium sp. Leaf394]